MTTIRRPIPLLGRLTTAWLPAAKFMAVGASGIVVNTVVMALVVTGGIHYLVAAVVATQCSTVWNFGLTDRWVFAERRGSAGTLARFARFWAVNNAFLLLRGPMLWLLTDAMGMHYLVANVVSLVVVFVGRYAISAGWIWRSVAERWGRWAQLDTYAIQGPTPALAEVPVDRPGVSRAVTRERIVRWMPWLALGIVLLVAAFLRLRGIGAIGFNSDESVYAGQGAAMFGGDLDQYFSLFRAHPLLLQMLVGLLFQVFGVSDFVARVFVAGVFGVGAVVMTYVLAAQAYSRRVGLVAAALLATMPYHVIVSRQVLVDVPMAFFILVAMYLIKRGVDSSRQEWFLAAAAAASLATLAKEVAVLFILAMVIYLTWGRSWRWVSRWTIAGAGLVYLIGISPFILSRALFSADGESGVATFFWQFARDPNHSGDYFARILFQYWGIGLVALALWGLWAMVRRRDNGDILFLSVLVTFLGFFQAWPTKLFFYLVAVTPVLAIAAALGIERLAELLGRVLSRMWNTLRRADVVVAAVLASVVFTTIFTVIATNPSAAQVPGAGDFDIEVQSFAGGREVAEWIGDNTPTGSRFLTIGPSIGNIVRFYGHRDSVALSVSSDSTKRNPAYVPVTNPDLAIRTMDVHYLIWDAYSADRSVFYDRQLRFYMTKYHGIPVFSTFLVDGELTDVAGPVPAGGEPRIIVYSVAGGNPPQNGSP